eukprot:2724744-Rhodomonas_salina.5
MMMRWVNSGHGGRGSIWLAFIFSHTRHFPNCIANTQRARLMSGAVRPTELHTGAKAPSQSAAAASGLPQRRARCMSPATDTRHQRASCSGRKHASRFSSPVFLSAGSWGSARKRCCAVREVSVSARASSPLPAERLVAVLVTA